MQGWNRRGNWSKLQFCRYQEYRMDRYTAVHSFVLVAEAGSFAAAALKEGVTPVVMGRRLDALERHLGVKLMHRSTRGLALDRKSTRLNSSHVKISYAVFCLKKKKSET